MLLYKRLDHLVLFTGDGDFVSLVKVLQKKGKRVSVVSTLRTRQPMVSDDLRRQADQFIDLADIGSKIGRVVESRRRQPIAPRESRIQET